MVFLLSDDFLVSPRPSSKTKKCLSEIIQVP